MHSNAIVRAARVVLHDNGPFEHCMNINIHIQIPPTGYVGLIWCSTAEATASWSTVEGTLRVKLQLLWHRGVRGYRQKTRKNSVKLVKNVKNRLKIKEKAEILAQFFSFKNEEISWKEELSHPWWQENHACRSCSIPFKYPQQYFNLQ